MKVIVRSGFEEMKASPWEKQDAIHEDIPILNFLVPKEFKHKDGALYGMTFEKVHAEYDARGRRRLVPTGEPDHFFECDDVLVAIGQENAFPWIERDIGLEFNEWDMPVVDEITFQSTNPRVFFGGDSAFGPKNIIWAVAHGHQAAISIHKLCQGEDIKERPAPGVNVTSTKMGIHEWSYDNDVSLDLRFKVPHRDKAIALQDIKAEVELGFDDKLAFAEAQRCLNCDVQTVFTDKLCIECDACVDICPVDCISFVPNGDEADLRTRLSAPATNLTQSLYISVELKTGRIMAKDEDVCLHCGLCAERCPTGAWDMERFLIDVAQTGTMGRRTHAATTRPCGSPPAGQRLRRQVRQCERLRFGECQLAVRQGGPAHGRGVDATQHFPEQHPGPADLVRGPRLRGRPSGRARRRGRPDGGDEPADLG